VAKALDVPLPRVNDHRAREALDLAEMAVLLSAYFGTSDGYWINLQGISTWRQPRKRSASKPPGSALILTAQTADCSQSEVNAAMLVVRSVSYRQMIEGDPPTAGSATPRCGSPVETLSGDRPAQLPSVPAPRRNPRPVRRVPRPRITGLLDSPVHNLVMASPTPSP